MKVVSITNVTSAKSYDLPRLTVTRAFFSFLCLLCLLQRITKATRRRQAEPETTVPTTIGRVEVERVPVSSLAGVTELLMTEFAVVLGLNGCVVVSTVGTGIEVKLELEVEA